MIKTLWQSRPRRATAVPATASPAAGRRAWAGTVLAWSCWLYLLGVLGAWGLLHSAADQWWPATLLMFGPRWVLALPIVGLAPLALFVRRRSLWPLLAGLLLVLGPVMGFNVPWQALVTEEDTAPVIRVLCCNVHYGQLDGPALGALIAETRADIVALQGWSSRHQESVLGQGPWHTRRDGELLLVSRFPIRAGEALQEPCFSPEKGAAARYVLESPIGELTLVNLHLATPRDGLEAIRASWWNGAGELQANSDLRREQSEAISRWINSAKGPVLVVGDSNTPVESQLYRQSWSQFTDAFSSAGIGWGYTHYTRWSRLRIDHVLAGPGWRCRQCWVGPNVGSPHRPVIAEIMWLG